MNGLKKEEHSSGQNGDNSKFHKKTNFIVTLTIFVVENSLWEQYVRIRNSASEEEIQKRNEEKKKTIEKIELGIPFLHAKIALKDGRDAFIFYNQSVEYAEKIGNLLEAERYIFANLEDDDSFNIYFLKECHKYGAYFKNLDRKIMEPKLKRLPLKYEKEEEFYTLSSLFNLGASEEYKKFKDFGFDIDFSSLRNSIEIFEKGVAKLYPSVKTNLADRDYFYDAIKDTFNLSIGPACVNAMKREKNISIINNGVLFKQRSENISELSNVKSTLPLFQEKMEFIRTIAFISIESGMWEQYAKKSNILTNSQIEEYNEKLLTQLKDCFLKDKIAYTMLSKYNGDKEDKTFVIYNVPFEYVEDIAKKTLQESFLWMVKYYSNSFDFSHYSEKGKVCEYLKYMDMRHKNCELKMPVLLEYKTEYIEEASITEITYKDDFNEGVCKKLKNFGFNLDSLSFEGVLQEFDESIRKLYPQVEGDSIAKRYLSKKIYESIYKTRSGERSIINSGKLFESL